MTPNSAEMETAVSETAESKEARRRRPAERTATWETAVRHRSAAVRNSAARRTSETPASPAALRRSVPAETRAARRDAPAPRLRSRPELLRNPAPNRRNLAAHPRSLPEAALRTRRDHTASATDTNRELAARPDTADRPCHKPVRRPDSTDRREPPVDPACRAAPAHKVDRERKDMFRRAVAAQPARPRDSPARRVVDREELRLRVDREPPCVRFSPGAARARNTQRRNTFAAVEESHPAAPPLLLEV